MDWNNPKKFIAELLLPSGIQINGPNPWDMQVHSMDVYNQIVKRGSLGLGEAYMNRLWDCGALDQFFERLLRTNVEDKVKNNKRAFLKFLLLKLFNFQTKERAFMVGEKHYDLGNTLFQYMLDPQMNYTCGYWEDAENLEQAQINKLKLTCEKLILKPGMRILDIGCGWGALARFAAENYGVNVVGVTISKEQCAYAKLQCANLPIDIRLQDYRDVHEKFDRVVSLGMFEHVGQSNYRHYMKVARNCLKDNGIFLLHTIGANKPIVTVDEWIEKYIFPNGRIPSASQVSSAYEGLFTMEDWHNFGPDYDKTLIAWHANFERHWQELKSTYDDRFYRMWSYYLLSCAGSFRARDLQLWQIVLSANGLAGGYHAPRKYFKIGLQSSPKPAESPAGEKAEVY